jgi:hypothetical protein
MFAGAALAANNHTDRDKFAAKAAPTRTFINLCVLCASAVKIAFDNSAGFTQQGVLGLAYQAFHRGFIDLFV